MKMISSTSMTSTIGVTLMSPITLDRSKAFMMLSPRDELSATCWSAAWVSPVNRSLIAASPLGHRPRHGPRLHVRLVAEQEVGELLRPVLDLHADVLDPVHEVVVEPYRGDSDEETESGRDQGFRDTGRDRRKAAAARGRHAGERVHDTHGGAEKAHERRGRADRRQHAQTATQARQRLERVELDRPLDRGGLDRRQAPVLREQHEVAEYAAEGRGQVAPLVLLHQVGRGLVVLVRESLRELRREGDRLLAGAPEL